MNDELNAAHNLTGLILKSGWEVLEKIPTDNTTGGYFSVCYKVKRREKGNTRICFLKAFDYIKFFSIPGGNDIADKMAEVTNAFVYERDISKVCRDNHVSKILAANEADIEVLPNYVIPQVPYLIFDLATCDVRQKIVYSDDCNIAWKCKSLHSVAVGLKQLHYIMVSHQDLKPSNVLVLDDDTLIGDLGRSQSPLHKSPFNDQEYSGDYTYAPPEIMYGSYNKDWKLRAFAIDLYLLGSLAVFYFTGFRFSTLLYDNIPDNFHWRNWHDSFDSVKDYLLNGFSLSLQIVKEELTRSIGDNIVTKDLLDIVSYLCYPFPEMRGHPKTNLVKQGVTNGNPYDLERVVSAFDLLQFRSRFLSR